MQTAKLALSLVIAAQFSFGSSSGFAQETATGGKTTEVKAAEGSSSTEASNVVPGFWEKERTELRGRIKLLEKKGVGVKPYETAFNEIEELVKKGETEKFINSKITRLNESIDTQLDTLGVISGQKPPVDQPFTPPKVTLSNKDIYHNKLIALIKKQWIPKKGVDDDVRVSFAVSADGTISDVTLHKKSEGAAAAQERVRKIVADMKKLPAPPAKTAPLKLLVSVCSKHGIEVEDEFSGNVDFAPYMVELQRRIKRAWRPPKGDESKRVTVLFKLNRDGTLLSRKVSGTSGIPLADQAALKAVDNARPFDPLPAGSPKDVDINFTFDYNVFKGTGSGGTFRRF